MKAEKIVTSGNLCCISFQKLLRHGVIPARPLFIIDSSKFYFSSF